MAKSKNLHEMIRKFSYKHNSMTLGFVCVFVCLSLCQQTNALHKQQPPTTSSLVLPHDTYPGFSIKKFKTHPISNNATHNYRLKETGFSKYFTVLDNGMVMTTSDISPLVDRPVNLVVLEDTPNTTEQHEMQLYVMHRNDMVKFPGSEMDISGEVKENQPAGTKVRGIPILEAFVGKQSPNVKYSIIGGNEENSFSLQDIKTRARQSTLILENDNENGNGVWLVASKPLDREHRKEYDLSIQASDEDELDKVVSRVFITILDENDNRPIFENDEYKFFIPGEKSVDLNGNATVTWRRFAILGKVHATDADGDRIAYRLTTPSNIVVVVPQTGEILLANEPQTSELALEVEAHDLRYPSLASQKKAKVLIEFIAPEPVSFVMQHLDHDEVNQHSHHREKRRVTRAVRPTKRIEFTEADGDTEGKSVFALEKETDRETFKIRDENPWVSVESNGAVRVKKKWDYEELGPEKTIDFWVIITNAGQSGEFFTFYMIFSLSLLQTTFRHM